MDCFPRFVVTSKRTILAFDSITCGSIGSVGTRTKIQEINNIGSWWPALGRQNAAYSLAPGQVVSVVFANWPVFFRYRKCVRSYEGLGTHGGPRRLERSESGDPPNKSNRHSFLALVSLSVSLSTQNNSIWVVSVR